MENKEQDVVKIFDNVKPTENKDETKNLPSVPGNTCKDVEVYSDHGTKQHGVIGTASSITANDLRLPKVILLQGNSPFLREENSPYKYGEMINSLTLETYGKSLIFTPIFIFKNVIKWRDRKEGGGIIYKSTNFNDPKVIKDISWSGTTKPAATLFINVIGKIVGSDLPSIISFSMTSLKAGQDLLSLVHLSKTVWSYQYILGSVSKQSPSGNYLVYTVKRGVKNTDPELLAECEDLYYKVKDMGMDNFIGSEEDIQATHGAEPEEF